MYQNNPALLEAVARDHVAELRRTITANARGPREKPRRSTIEAARRGTGWLLVDMGLRLALPRAALSHPSPRGQR